MARLPAVFFGHGSPMNALEDNPYTRAWARIGAELPRPRAVLAISAHWYGPGTHVTAMEHPPTIHDFGNFPPELHAFAYPAPGDPALAARVAELLAPAVQVTADDGWGLDHGTWSVLAHVYPRADVPVVQLSLDAGKPPAFHYGLGERLAVLRDENVLVMASGNVVHNLRELRGMAPAAEGWADRFERRVRELAGAGDGVALTRFTELPDARRAVPTAEHYLPLLPIVGTRRDGEPITFPTTGTVGGALSMLSVRVG